MVTPGGQRAGGRVLARRYHLQRVLGRGAMGAVWEAEDTFLRRTVAVKEVVLPGSLSPEERAVSCERTLREARAIARLGHPNVVTLFDVLDEDSRPWVVMELVPSRSLAEVIKEDGPLHPLRVATVGLAILGALEAAHAAGITHRDVKPGNILLGHDGRVKLTDFGIARAAGDDTITGTGLLVGSPSYIAPEIVKGLEAGAPADLWGLGATLYAAAEGRAPFSGGDAMETLSKVVQEPPTPYERAGVLVPALDAMLEKDPAKRARPVEARRALLDVLRGGNETESPGRSGRAASPAAAPPTAPSPAPGPAPASASASASAETSGPGLADLLVPVWRQGRYDEAPAGTPPAREAASAAPAAETGAGTPNAATGAPAASGTGGAGPAAGAGSATGTGAAGSGRGAAAAGPASGAAGAGPGRGAGATGPASGTHGAGGAPGAVGAGVSGAAAAGGAVALQHDAAAVARDAGGATAGAPAVPSEAGGAAAEEDGVPARSVRGGRNDVAAGSARGGRNDVVAGSADGAGNDVATGPARGAEDASARGAEDASARGAEDASARGAEDAKDAQEAPRAPRSVAGSTVSQRARDLLAYDADLVDPEVADPDLVGLDLDGTHTDLGLPPRPAGAPAEEETRTWFTARSRPAAPAAAEDRAERDAGAHGDTAGSTAAGMVRDRAERDAGAHGDTAGTTAAGMDWDRADEAGDAGGEAGTDPEATVTLPTHPLSGAGRPPSPQAPAYGSYGGDDELHTERIAPLPFGRPPAQQQPARAFRAQPPSPPLDFKDERSRGDRRRRGLAALLAVVVLVAVVLAGGFLLIRSLRGSGDARVGGTPSATASLGPATIPSGYTRFAGSGFTVGVPVGWPAKEQRDGVVDAREPDSTRFLRMITVDSTAPALEQLSAAEKQFAADPSYGSYQRVRLEKIDYRGLNAADWEFTFTLDGVPRHVLYRGIVSDGRTFGLYLSTPADQWTNSTDVFRVAADTFRTG